MGISTENTKLHAALGIPWPKEEDFRVSSGLDPVLTPARLKLGAIHSPSLSFFICKMEIVVCLPDRANQGSCVKDLAPRGVEQALMG